MWTLGAFEYLRLFLDQIVMSVIVVFVVLSALVVFTLLLSNADAKTYEYGMLRALVCPPAFAVPCLPGTLGSHWCDFTHFTQVFRKYL